MSYPPATYHGTGEASARLTPSGTPPDLTYNNKVEVHYLASGASTRGQFGLYRWTFGQHAAGPIHTSTAAFPSRSSSSTARWSCTTAAAGAPRMPGTSSSCLRAAYTASAEPDLPRCCSFSPPERLAKSTSRRWPNLRINRCLKRSVRLS